MEGEPQAASKKASREASEWFVFLQDDPDDLALRRRFDKWLGASPENALAWSETLHTSSLAKSLLPFDARDWDGAAAKAAGAGDLDARRRPPTSAMAGPGRKAAASVALRPKHRWLVPFVASIAAAWLLLFLAPAAILRLQSDYSTGFGQVQDVALPDGSVVTLAPGSAIAVSYTDAERQVRLLTGEAFFSVEPNAGRPFRVVARSVRASVLGTSFDVQLEKHEVGVSVREGTVQVDSAGVAEVLGAGQSLRVAGEGGAAQRSSLPPHMIGTWRQGQLAMEDGPLGAAVEQLDRYFDGTIILADASLGERPVTGVFDLRDPEDALRAMAKALGIRVWKVTPWVLRVGVLSPPTDIFLEKCRRTRSQQ